MKLALDKLCWISGRMRVPEVRGRTNQDCLFAVTRTRLPADPVGTFTLRLKNVVRGSRYRVEVSATGALQDAAGEGTVPAGTGDTTDLDVTLPYFPAGNAANDLRIKVRKASASPYYRPFETQSTAQAGTVIAYIAQQLDE